MFNKNLLLKFFLVLTQSLLSSCRTDNKLSSILNVQNTTNTVSSDDEEGEPFQANLINSAVYIVSMTLQISTFAVNYRVSFKLNN